MTITPYAILIVIFSRLTGRDKTEKHVEKAAPLQNNGSDLYT